MPILKVKKGIPFVWVDTIRDLKHLEEIIVQINKLRINNMENPLGYAFERLSISYLIDQEPKEPLVLYLREGDHNGELLHTQQLDYRESIGTEISFKPQPETRYCLQIRAGQTQSAYAYFETGTTFDCSFITPSQPISHPVLFKRFRLEKRISKARLYVTGLGVYEAYINQQKAGNEYLAPGCNDYDAYVQYQTYDVTDSVKTDNLIEIHLGNGWYKGQFGLTKKKDIYGSDYVTAAKLVVWYPDGSKQTIAETNLTWNARPSIVTDSGIYDGEIQDANQNMSSVYPVKIVERAFKVEPRISLPIIVKQTLTPDLIISPKGENILDFGQNFTGFMSFDVLMSKDQTIRLQAGEVLQEGCFYRDNLRAAKAEFIYKSDGIRREVRPHFTFFGFRYLLVEGLSEVDPKAFKGNVIYSDLEQTIVIATDNPKINRLLQNCLWSHRSNFVDVPTDCPQRDERLGWTGDAVVFSKTACYQMHCQNFFDKYLKDMRIDQDQFNGMIAYYSPSFREGSEAGSVWSDAATIIPWNVYMAYGDKGFLTRHYPLMERYVRTLITRDDANGGKRLYHFGFHLGDWLSQDGATPSALKGATNEYFIASVYYYNSIRIISDASRELGYKENELFFRKILEQVREAILNEYFSVSGRLAIDTQTAYSLCVNFDLYKDITKLQEGFAERIKKDSYKIKGGFVGATQLIQALIKSGLSDEAFRILYQEAFPSWLYCVNLGATTIWERWNSLNPDGSISGTGMNSLNHYAFGSVGEAFYAYIAGLRALVPGFKKVVIEPKFNYRLRTLAFSYDSPSGKFTINYQINSEGQVELYIHIPFGVEAELIIGDKRWKLTGGDHKDTILADHDLSHPFSIDSTVYELITTTKTQTVLKQHVPTLFAFLSQNDFGFYGHSLRQLCSLQSFYVAPEVLNLINDDLIRIAID